MPLLAALTLTLALATPSETPPSTACPPSVVLPAALDRVLRDYEIAWSKGDAKALATLFVEDGFVMSMGDPPARGRAEIVRRYTGVGGGPLFLHAIAFSTDGSTGFILGCYATAPKDPDIGKFTLTLKKDAAGRWLIVSDMDNPNGKRCP